MTVKESIQNAFQTQVKTPMFSSLYTNIGLKIKKTLQYAMPSKCKFFKEQNDRSVGINN